MSVIPYHRVTTCLENLEMKFDQQFSCRNLTAVSKTSGILLKCPRSVGKNLAGKSGLKLFIVSCIFASILNFTLLNLCILVLDHGLLDSYPTTDNNTRTGMT